MTQRERSIQARRKWQRLVSEQGRSGQSVSAFCRERKLCASHFFWWEKRLRASALGRFLEVKLAAAAPAGDDFSSATLALPWTFLDIPQPGLYSLTERPGFLRLHGQGAGLEYSSQATFVARRQTEWNGTAATRLEFDPVNDREEAGLAIFMSPDYHYEIYETRIDGKLSVALRKSVGDIRIVTATAEIGRGALQLKMEYDPEDYRFFYKGEGGEWKFLGSGPARLI